MHGGQFHLMCHQPTTSCIHVVTCDLSRAHGYKIWIIAVLRAFVLWGPQALNAACVIASTVGTVCQHGAPSVDARIAIRLVCVFS